MTKPKKNKNSTRKRKKRKSFWSSLCCGQVEKEHKSKTYGSSRGGDEGGGGGEEEDDEPCAYIVEKLAVKRVPLRVFESENTVEGALISKKYTKFGTTTHIERITKVKDAYTAAASCKSISSTTSTTDLISTKDFKPNDSETVISSYYLTDVLPDQQQAKSPRPKSPVVGKNKKTGRSPCVSPPRNVYMFQSEAPFAVNHKHNNAAKSDGGETGFSQNTSRAHHHRRPTPVTDMHQMLLGLGYKQPKLPLTRTRQKKFNEHFYNGSLEQVNQITYSNGYNSPRFYNAEKPYVNKVVNEGLEMRKMNVERIFQDNVPMTLSGTKTLTHDQYTMVRSNENFNTVQQTNVRYPQHKKRANFTTSTHTYYYYNRNDQNNNFINNNPSNKKHETTQIAEGTSSSDSSKDDNKHYYNYRPENSEEIYVMKKFEEDHRCRGAFNTERKFVVKDVDTNNNNYRSENREVVMAPDKNGAAIYRESKMHVNPSDTPCTKLYITPHIIKNDNPYKYMADPAPPDPPKFRDMATSTIMQFPVSKEPKLYQNKHHHHHLLHQEQQTKTDSEKSVWRIFIKEQELGKMRKQDRNLKTRIPVRSPKKHEHDLINTYSDF